MQENASLKKKYEEIIREMKAKHLDDLRHVKEETNIQYEAETQHLISDHDAEVENLKVDHQKKLDQQEIQIERYKAAFQKLKTIYGDINKDKEQQIIHYKNRIEELRSIITDDAEDLFSNKLNEVNQLWCELKEKDSQLLGLQNEKSQLLDKSKQVQDDVSLHTYHK